jgi:lipopolysaccharide export system protein LptA
MFMWMWLLLLNLLMGSAVPATSSAEEILSKDQALPNPSTNITAKTMTVSNQENKAIFDGSVVLTRGELVV